MAIFLALGLAMLMQSQPEVTVAESAATVRLKQALPELAAMPDVELVGYEVSGRSARAVRESMNRVRPSESTGGRFDGLTQWRFHSRFRNINGRCDPKSFEVRTTVKVTLPVLSEPQRLNRRDKAIWDRYFAALSQHETNHVRIAVLGGQRMQEAIRKEASCDGLRELGERMSAEVAEASSEYDRMTDHGKREGAVFP